MRISAVLVLSLAVAGCGNKGGGDVPPPVNQTVGSTGGSVTNSDGDGVSIPPGALPGDTMISVTSTPDAPAPPTAMPVGTPITFGPEGQQFLKPVTVTISFDPAKIPSGKTASTLAIFTAPAGTTAYTQLTTTVVDATHLSAQVSHFSTFVAGSPTGCAVSCGAFASGGCTGGPVFDGGAPVDMAGSCTTTMGCGCSAYCNADGTPAQAQTCTGAPQTGGGSGGTGGTPGGTDDMGGNCTPGTGNSYSIQCTTNGCVCMVNGQAMATLAAIDCSADPSSFIAQYTACGFPGIYVPPTPVPDGGGQTNTGSPDGGSGGGGTIDAGTGGGGPPDMSMGGIVDLSAPPGSPGAPCQLNTDCLSGTCLVNKICQ